MDKDDQMLTSINTVILFLDIRTHNWLSWIHHWLYLSKLRRSRRPKRWKLWLSKLRRRYFYHFHMTARWKRSNVFWTGDPFQPYTFIFVIIWPFSEEGALDLEYFLKHFDGFALLLEMVFALNWKMVPPKNLFLVFQFVHLGLFQVGLSTIFVPAKCPVPVFFNTVTERMGLESFHLMSPV